jgi:hypothetical protein
MRRLQKILKSAVFSAFLLFFSLVSLPGLSQKKQPERLIYSILQGKAAILDSVLANPSKFGLQIIFTEINRQKNGAIKFSEHSFGVDPNTYFYPASTVKLPIAMLSLQRLNELKVPGLTMNSSMETGSNRAFQTEVYNDPTSKDGRPSIAQYIKKVLLVSDNDAFNRMYEFLGQEYINSSLRKHGYYSPQILHRLSIPLSTEENRITNPITFYDSACKVIYHQPEQISKFSYVRLPIFMGTGYYSDTTLMKAPFDFTNKNLLRLKDLNRMVKQVFFPETMNKNSKISLTDSDYVFLRKYMGMVPAESDYPSYDSVNYPDNYVKFLYYGAEPTAREPNLRIYNKVGDAYGFLTDAAYFQDSTNGVEFLLSCTIYCNSDGIFNDDKYDYQTIGLPFMKELGKAVYKYVLDKAKK